MLQKILYLETKNDTKYLIIINEGSAIRYCTKFIKKYIDKN